MKKQTQRKHGFSIVEMTLSTLLVMSLSAVSYRVLKNQTTQQMTSMETQKNGSTAQAALARFKKDASMIDPNWIRYGVAAIYPQQGLGLGENFYLRPRVEQKNISLNDGVTFLRRDQQNDKIYVPITASKSFCHPTAVTSAGEQQLYDTDIKLNTVANLAAGDWMLVYQAGDYALGIITAVSAQSSQLPPASSGQTTSSSTLTVDGSSGVVNAATATENPRGVFVSGATQTVIQTGLSGGMIKLRRPNVYEAQLTQKNSASMSTGFVIRAGVVPASFDLSGKETAATDDDTYCFDAAKFSLQKIASPVSYFADYQTSDGNSKSASNTYVLDKRGQPVKMLVRAEYINTLQKREYIAPVNDVGFSYDLLDDSIGGAIARDVGRSNASTEFLNLAASNSTETQSLQTTSAFISSYRIAALKMILGVTVKDPKDPKNDWKQNQEVKVALDSSTQKGTYKSSTTVTSAVTDTLKTNTSAAGRINEQIGKPLYLANSGTDEVLVPVSTFEVLSDGSMGPNSRGALYAYTESGCSVNSGAGCAPSANDSAVVFNAGQNTTFFPNTIARVMLPGGGSRIIVGGVAIQTDANGATPIRKSGIGIIELAAGETLASKLSSSAVSGSCNIANCSWKNIDTADTSVTPNLVDTANMAINPYKADELYISTMTKKTGETSTSAVYKGEWNGSDYTYTKYADVLGTEQGRIITAISDQTIRINGEDYLAVCTSKRISSACAGGECLQRTSSTNKENYVQAIEMRETLGYDDVATLIGEEPSPYDGTADLGEIQLISAKPDGFGGNTVKRVTLTKHNYLCSSISVDKDQNLLVSGRLALQGISNAEIKRAVAGTSGANKLMYLDEIVGLGSDRSPIYADFYQVDPTTFQNPANPEYIGWLTGMSAVEFANGTFGIVTGNKFRVKPGFGINHSGTTTQEYSNAGISQVRLAGVQDRIVATIQTDPSNMNNSVISATYATHASQLPSVYIPGTFMINGVAPRISPTPLPSMPPAMSEASWFELYRAMRTPHDSSGLNSNMPALGETTRPSSLTCADSRPPTCQY